MTKETRELTEQIADFGAGMNAYKNGDGHLYLASSKDWQDGYREAFDADLPSRYFDGSGFQAELAWDQHYFDEIHHFKAEVAEQVAKKIALTNLAYNLVFLAFGVLIGSLVTAGAAQEVFGK